MRCPRNSCSQRAKVLDSPLNGVLHVDIVGVLDKNATKNNLLDNESEEFSHQQQADLEERQRGSHVEGGIELKARKGKV